MTVEDGGLWQRQDGKQSNFGFGIYKGVFGMTRREEIEQQASLTVFPWDDVREQSKFEDGFIEGAKWADKTMIEKACDWLMRYGCEYATEEVMVEHFRKDMEE